MTTDAERAASKRVHEVIAAEAHSLGPQELDDEGEPLEGRPLQGALLQEWVLVMAWTQPGLERGFLTRATSLGLPLHHENGLLHEALYNFD